MIRRLTILLLIVGCIYGHNGHHQFLTPYISPGIQIGYNGDKTLFLSCQLTIGSGFKIGDHFEDTMPLLLGKTFGLRAYYQDNTPLVVYKYSDNQISFMFGGIGTGKIIDSNGNSFKKNKYWIGALGLFTYEKIFFDEKVQKQSGLSVVFPYPIEMAFVE
jgi:hypothetical protein